MSVIVDVSRIQRVRCGIRNSGGLLDGFIFNESLSSLSTPLTIPLYTFGDDSLPFADQIATGGSVCDAPPRYTWNIGFVIEGFSLTECLLQAVHQSSKLVVAAVHYMGEARLGDARLGHFSKHKIQACCVSVMKDIWAHMLNVDSIPLVESGRPESPLAESDDLLLEDAFCCEEGDSAPVLFNNNWDFSRLVNGVEDAHLALDCEGTDASVNGVVPRLAVVTRVTRGRPYWSRTGTVCAFFANQEQRDDFFRKLGSAVNENPGVRLCHWGGDETEFLLEHVDADCLSRVRDLQKDCGGDRSVSLVNYVNDGLDGRFKPRALEGRRARKNKAVVRAWSSVGLELFLTGKASMVPCGVLAEHLRGHTFVRMCVADTRALACVVAQSVGPVEEGR